MKPLQYTAATILAVIVVWPVLRPPVKVPLPIESATVTPAAEAKPTIEAPPEPVKPADKDLANPEHKFPEPLDKPADPPRCCGCSQCTGKPGCNCGCPNCTCNLTPSQAYSAHVKDCPQCSNRDMPHCDLGIKLLDAATPKSETFEKPESCKRCEACFGNGAVRGVKCETCGGDGVICSNDAPRYMAPELWQSLSDAKQDAKSRGVPLFIKFTMGQRCNPCIQREKNVYSDSAVKQTLQAKFALAEVGPGPDARSYGVSSYPTCAVVRKDGSVDKFIPPNDAKGFLERLNQAANPKIFQAKKPANQAMPSNTWRRGRR